MPVSHSLVFAGETFLALRSGALLHPGRGLLLVADLHLEKGSAYARGGQFLPPYDSHMTLAQLEADIASHQPQNVICLGDSFHDVDGPNRLEEAVKTRLQALTTRLSWLWITGNHDPHLPENLGGTVTADHCLECHDGTLHLRHEPTETMPQDGKAETEICGHLHPVATIPSRGRSLRRKCFLVCDKRIILPAYGAYTGGLNIRDEAFAPFITPDSRLMVIGRQTITELPLRSTSLSRGRPRSTRQRS